MTENYNAIQQNFETSVTSQPTTREKSRSSSSRATSSRSSRVIQQPQQQHVLSTYQTGAQQTQNSRFQPSQTQPSYAMEIQLTPVQNQQPVQITTLNDQSVNVNQISSIVAAAAAASGHVQNLVTVQHNFTQAANSPLQTQQRAIRPLPPTPPMSTKPYKIVQPQQCYKFPNLTQNFNAQQCKFNTNNFKVG